MRSYFIIIGSVSFFEKNLQKLSAKGAEFNDVITLFDTVRTAGKMPQKLTLSLCETITIMES